MRNRGTIGGSIALGEPAAELPATSVALGATVEVRSTRGTRQIKADELYFGPYATALEPDELITAIDYPEWRSEEHTSETQSLMRRSYAVFCLKKKKHIHNAATNHH